MLTLTIKQVNWMLYVMRKAFSSYKVHYPLKVEYIKEDDEINVQFSEVLGDSEGGVFNSESCHDCINIPIKALKGYIKEHNVEGNIKIWLRIHRLGYNCIEKYQNKIKIKQDNLNKVISECTALKTAYDTTGGTTILKLINEHEKFIESEPKTIEGIINSMENAQQAIDEWVVILNAN